MPVQGRGKVSGALLQLEMLGPQGATNLAGSRAAWLQGRKATLEKNEASPEQGWRFSGLAAAGWACWQDGHQSCRQVA